MAIHFLRKSAQKHLALKRAWINTVNTKHVAGFNDSNQSANRFYPAYPAASFTHPLTGSLVNAAPIGGP